MPPESWIEKAVELFGTKTVFWGITILVLLGIIATITAIARGIVQICHLRKRKDDYIPSEAFKEIATLATESNNERKTLAADRNKMHEDNAKLRKDLDELEEEHTQLSATCEAKDKFIVKLIDFMEDKAKEFLNLSDKYNIVMNDSIMDLKKKCARIILLLESNLDRETLLAIHAIDARVASMSEADLELKAAEFIEISNAIERDAQRKSLSKKDLAHMLAEAKQRNVNSKEDGRCS